MRSRPAVISAIIDVPGIEGPKEMRAINGLDGDRLGEGAPVYHARSPQKRELSATQGAKTARGGREPSIRGPRNESINPHLNDAEIKLFEDIIRRLPKDATGTIHFITVQVREENGQLVIQEYPACSGCIRASFETAGLLPRIDLVSHAPVYPPLAAEPHGGTEPHPGADEHGNPPAQAAKAPVKPPAAGVTEAEPSSAKGMAAKTGMVTDAEPPAQKTTGTTTPVGHASQAAVHIGVGVASLVVGILAARRKAQVDERIAQRQVDAYTEIAKKWINANPDDALKKMMFAPEVTVHAWVYLDSSVITFFGVDSESIEPPMSDSSPLLEPAGIDYAYGPADQSLVGSLSPRFSGGGRHMTVTRTIVVDIPLLTPPVEEMLAYAKTRNLPLDGLLDYVRYRRDRAMADQDIALATREQIWAAYQISQDAYQEIQAAFQTAKKHHNVELQKKFAALLNSFNNSSGSTKLVADEIKLDDRMQKADQEQAYWQHLVDSILPAMR